MEQVYQDIPRVYTALAEWGGCIVFICLLEKRFSLKCTIFACGVALVVQMVLMIITENLPLMFWIPSMLVAFLSMYLFLSITCKITIRHGVYCCACAFLLAEFAASLEWQLYVYFALQGVIGFLSRVVWPIFCYAVIYMIYYRMQKSLLSREYLRQLSIREVVAAVGIVIFAFTFSNLSFILQDSPFTSRVLTDIFNIRTLVDLGSVAVLYAYQSRICEYMIQKKMDTFKIVMKSQYDQYRNYQKSIELVHIKAHDLKHQIDGLRAEQDKEKREAWLEQMESELEDIILPCKTGNTVLDTLLGAKLSQARKLGIRITCVADGSLLSFLHVTDICAIFGNALDNAIESVVLIPEEEKRLIHLEVSEQKNFIYIKILNYCGKEQELKTDKIPLTTKRDKMNHGYGLKSIRYAVEKYGGSMTIGITKKWFELKILIPRGNM